MSAHENTSRKYLTYDFPTIAHAWALRYAYLECGVFKEPEDEEQKQLFDVLANIEPNQSERFAGTEKDMKQTVALLTEWGEANSLHDASEPEPQGSSRFRRAASPHFISVTARIALDMAEEMTMLVAQAPQQPGVTFDMAEIYDFLGDSDAA